MPRPDSPSKVSQEVGNKNRQNGNGFSGVAPHYYEIPQSKNPQTLDESNESLSNFQLNVQKPLYSLDEIVLAETVKLRVDRVVAEIENYDFIFDTLKMGQIHKADAGMIIGLYGPSGGGKTMLAHGIAHKLGLDILIVPSMQCKLVGDTEKMIERLFDFASKQIQPLLIFWDEADRDFSSRIESPNQSADVGVNSARAILLQKLTSYKGIIVLATNLFRTYDNAFVSRIRYPIEVELPNEEARAKIWETQFSESVKAHFDSTVDFRKLAAQFSDVSGREIKKAALNGLVEAIGQHKDILPNFQLSQSHLVQTMEEVIAAKEAAAEKEIKLLRVDGVDKPPLPVTSTTS